MRQTFYILVVLFLSIFTSCGNNVENSCNETYTIDFADAVNVNEDLYLSNYAKGIDYIPLETFPESIMDGSQTDFMIFDSRMYIASHKDRSVYVYDVNGDFISKFKREGNVPEEYNSLFDIEFENDGNGAIVILCYNEIKRYNLDGKYLGNLNLEQFGARSYSNLFYTGNGVYAVKANYVTENDNYDKLILFDFNGKELNSIIIGAPLIAKLGEFTIVYNSRTYKTANSFNVLNISKDTIFSYNHNLEMTPSYWIDCGKFEANLKSEDFMNKIIFGEKYHSIDTDDLFVIGFSYPKDDFINLNNPNKKVSRSNAIIYVDKKSGKTFIPKFDSKYGVPGVVNDLDGGAPFIPEFVQGDCMYEFVDAIDFIEYASISNSVKVKEIASQINEESNPVLVKVTLK